MVLLQRTFAAIAIVLVAISGAAAKVTPVTYFFYCRVDVSQGDGMPGPGHIVPMTIVLDSSYPADTYTSGSHTITYSGGVGYDLPTPIRQIYVDHIKVDGLFDSVTIAKNDNGNSGISIASYATGDRGFVANLETTVSGVVRSLKIPAKIYPGNFKTAAFRFTLNPTQSFSGTIVE